MGSPPIESRMRDFRRQVRRVLSIHGVAWLVVVAVGIVVASAFADWLMNLSTGVRVILLLSLAVASVWTAYRMLVMPLLFRLRDVDLALQVESQYPSLNDQLASAVEFGKEPATSHRSGSPALKAAVVEQVTSRLAAVDFGEVIDWTGTRRAVMSAGLVCALALGLVLASPGLAQIAVARLANPFGTTAWPRQTYLEIMNPPERLARGEPFQLTVQVVKGRVPDRADVHYQFEGGDQARESLRPHGDRQFTGGLEAVTRSFNFWVRAGDGSTESRRIEVVPPPEVTRLNVTLKYPAYTGMSSEQLPEDKGQVRAVWGTEVELMARVSKPLTHAELRIGTNHSVPAQMSDDSSELHARFKLESSGSYWIALRDELGFENRQASRYELKLIDDLAPDVFIEQPVSDIEVTPTADVPVRASIKDDFGLLDAALSFSRSSSEGANETVIWSGTDRPRRHVLEHVWHLAELDLHPGTSVSYRITARDTDDLRGPHVGQSRQLRLIVVTPEEIARRIEEKQTQVYQDLERLRTLQVDARLQVSGLCERLGLTSKLSKEDVARLQSAEMLQRNVQRQLASPSEGLQSKIAQIQQDLANNHVRDSAIQQQMSAVAAGLDQIAREHLPPIEQNLSRVRKGAEESTDAQAQQPALADARDHQDAVVSTLDELLEQMAKWETFRGIARDVRDLHDQQQQIASQTQATGERTIGKSRDSLTAEDQAELGRIAAKQEQLRDQLDRVQRKMDQMAERLGDTDAMGADSLREAVDGSRQSGTAELMQNAAASVRQNQVGQAETAERQAAEDLKQMLDTLENNTERDLARLVEKLRQAEAKISELQKRQLEQLERTREAQTKEEAEERRRQLQHLTRQQKQLEQEAARLAQQLRRLRAEKASKSSASAAGHMQQANQQLQAADGEQAEAEQQKVLEDLQRAMQETVQARREAEAQLAMEQLARIADTLAGLHDRQRGLKDESARLDHEVQQRGGWARSQLATLRSTAESQQAVRSDTERAREVLTSAPVFALTLSRAMANMDRAIELLGDRQAGNVTQTVQQAAADRIAQLLDALKSDANQEQQGAPDG